MRRGDLSAGLFLENPKGDTMTKAVNWLLRDLRGLSCEQLRADLGLWAWKGRKWSERLNLSFTEQGRSPAALVPGTAECNNCHRDYVAKNPDSLAPDRKCLPTDLKCARRRQCNDLHKTFSSRWKFIYSEVPHYDTGRSLGGASKWVTSVSARPKEGLDERWGRREGRGFLSSCVRTVGRSLACREGKGSWRAKMTWSTLLVYQADTGTKRVEGMRKTVARPGLGEECEP